VCRLPAGCPIVVSELVSSRSGRTWYTRRHFAPILQVISRRYSIRTQLLLVLIALSVFAWLIGGAVTILQAQKSTRIEVNAAMELAEALVRDAIPLVQRSASPVEVMASIPAQVGTLRHIRISVRDTSDAPIEAVSPKAFAPQRKDVRPPAPAWFAALIAPPVDSRRVPVVSEGRPLGSIVLSSAPGDEIAEVWDNATALAKVALVIGIGGIGLLYLLFGHVLAPLRSFAAGLLDLGRSDYTVRLPRPKTQELAVIAERFNSLASVLDSMRAENRRLSKRLISAQDDERRQTALDLHDEVGPYLFGLKVNTTSLANSLAGTPLESRAREMLTMIEGLQSINRSILNRLRPMALGQVPVVELLSALVGERAGQHPELPIAFSSAGLLPSYGESIDLTLYRCVQEGLTNIARHAKAKRASVTITHRNDLACTEDNAAQLTLTIADDGRGIDTHVQKGIGMQGMQERVQALGGECRFEATGGKGTLLRIHIPVPAAISAQSTPGSSRA
jgi:two-component system, NarL family, sensor histidine kinase UhpB